MGQTHPIYVEKKFKNKAKQRWAKQNISISLKQGSERCIQYGTALGVDTVPRGGDVVGQICANLQAQGRAIQTGNKIVINRNPDSLPNPVGKAIEQPNPISHTNQSGFANLSCNLEKKSLQELLSLLKSNPCGLGATTAADRVSSPKRTVRHQLEELDDKGYANSKKPNGNRVWKPAVDNLKTEHQDVLNHLKMAAPHGLGSSTIGHRVDITNQRARSILTDLDDDGYVNSDYKKNKLIWKL